MMKVLVGVGSTVVVLALVVFLIWPIVRHRTTFPGGTLSVRDADPQRWGLRGAEQVRITTDDGVRLHSWWVPADPGTARCGAVIYFHGNANTIAPRAWVGRRFAARGVDILMLDYRGYGLSSGRPSEEGLALDARAAWHYVLEERGVDPGRLVLLGHSLGSAVATELALERDAAGLILGAPFPGLPAAFAAHLPWLPVGLLPWTEDRFEVGGRIGDLGMPVLILAGERDALVTPDLSRRVFTAAPEPRRLAMVDAEHNTLLGHRDSWAAIDRFLAETLGCGG